MHCDIKHVSNNLFIGIKKPPVGELGRILTGFKPDIVIGHPTLRNADTIGSLVKKEIASAASIFAGNRVAIIISDGTCNKKNRDLGTINAALHSAERALGTLSDTQIKDILVYAGPHQGYFATSGLSGKGMALKMIFEEASVARPRAVIILDGDLRNDVCSWMNVYKNVLEYHKEKYGNKDFFVTARYARHFVDASITRMLVGPLTTLMGQYVPGGISGDTMISGGIAEKESKAEWSPARSTYGTDIATTLDRIASKNTVIYEVYLGAKLHDVTDDSKLKIMPVQVISSALERMLYYEKKDGRITKRINSNRPLARIISWDSVKTGINFIDPGKTNAFDIDAKREGLLLKFDYCRKDLEKTIRKQTFEKIVKNHKLLFNAVKTGDDKIVFLGVTPQRWIVLLSEVMGYVLTTGDIQTSANSLTYLYTAAFLEFCAERLRELGYGSVSAVRKAQNGLAVPGKKAEKFYKQNVDKSAEILALNFYRKRHLIKERIRELKKGT